MGQVGKITGQSFVSEWMHTLVGYVRSGKPDLTNRQMALLMLVYETRGHIQCGGWRRSWAYRNLSSLAP